MTFSNHVVIVRATSRTRGTIRCLVKFPLLNISARAQPTFGGKHCCGITLLRITARSAYFLFHLGHASLARDVVHLLRSESILGIKLSLGSSFSSLHGQTRFRPQNFLSLRNCIGSFNVRSVDLRGVCTGIFNRGVDGKRRLSG